MKIEMTQSHYANANGFKLIGAGVHEVDEAIAQYLLATFPSWFKSVEGESAPTKQENDAPQAPQTESEPDKPTKSLSKMNKDELVALADELVVDINAEMTNKQLQEAIKAHQEG